MAKAENKIKTDIKKFYEQIRLEYKIKKIFLFGSYAKGTANRDSDVDVAIVIDGLEKMDEIKIMANFYRKTKKINSLIEPFCISYKDYRYAHPSSILAGIIRSGITIM